MVALVVNATTTPLIRAQELDSGRCDTSGEVERCTCERIGCVDRIVLRLRRVRGSAERKMFSARERTHDAIRIVTNASHREFVDKCDTPVGWCRDAIGDFRTRDSGELPPLRRTAARSALQWTWTVTHTCSTALSYPCHGPRR